MKLIFIYGRPAVGKLTVARDLSALTGWRLFHNHLTVDLVNSVYDFGTPGFVDLREQIWLAVVARALADGLPGLIFTFNPENTVRQRFIDALFALVPEKGGEVVPIELVASEGVIERRLGAASRRQHGKLIDVALYRRLLAAAAFASPVVPPPRLRIDTEAATPEQAAAQIAAAIAG